MHNPTFVCQSASQMWNQFGSRVTGSQKRTRCHNGIWQGARIVQSIHRAHCQVGNARIFQKRIIRQITFV